MSTGARRRNGKVFHRQRADLLDARLRGALDAYALEGPWPITITSGPREGAAAEAEQRGYYASGASKAATLADTPHGRRAAFDFAVVRETNGEAVVSTYTANEFPDLYRQVGAWFESRGLVWGGRFSGFGALGDAPHVEVPRWRELPYPPGGGDIA